MSLDVDFDAADRAFYEAVSRVATASVADDGREFREELRRLAMAAEIRHIHKRCAVREAILFGGPGAITDV